MKTRFKLRKASGEHIAAVAYSEDAAALVGLWGNGAKVVWQNLVTVWTEGAETFSAAESYDAAGAVMLARIDAYWESLDAAKARRHNQGRTVTLPGRVTVRTLAESNQARAQDRADKKAARAAAAAINSGDYEP